MISFIIVRYVWQILGRGRKKALPYPWAAPKKPILNRVKINCLINCLELSNWEQSSSRAASYGNFEAFVQSRYRGLCHRWLFQALTLSFKLSFRHITNFYFWMYQAVCEWFYLAEDFTFNKVYTFFYKKSIFDPRPENSLSFSKKLLQKIV